MGSTQIVTYKCDWINEFGHDCPTTDTFEGKYHEDRAREAGWGYRRCSNRQTPHSWHTTYTWFCPLHSRVFGMNRGWVEDAKVLPPKNWENGPTRRKP